MQDGFEGVEPAVRKHHRVGFSYLNCFGLLTESLPSRTTKTNSLNYVRAGSAWGK